MLKFAPRSRIPAELKSRTPPYGKLVSNLDLVRKILPNQKLTLAEKNVYAHLTNPEESLAGSTNVGDVRGNRYLKLSPDRVAMQDASAQTALLQFMTTQMPSTAVPASIHCDHLIVGKLGATEDLKASLAKNGEVFSFLESCGRRYGIEFWPPGSGIIHQIVLENFSAPGLMMLGTDSHTPNAGGLGAIAIGVGGADAVDALTGTPWELKAPKILGVKLTGKLSGWASPKDVITTLAGELSVKGGTGYIIEYFGEGVQSLSCTGMATICNMGAEVGATTSTFPFTDAMHRYLQATERGPIGDLAAEVQSQAGFLSADEGAEYDKVIEIDLSTLEPHINGPFTPDLSTRVSQFAKFGEENDVPEPVSAGLIGSCTNSSYQDMTRVATLVDQAEKAGLKPRTPFFVTPGSEQIRATLQRDGLIDKFERNGAVVLANACGPCIGQWDRSPESVERTGGNAKADDPTSDPKGRNTIFTSFNRNFKSRNDGNPNTLNFLTSPEIVTAMSYAGSSRFNPLTDTVPGTDFKFSPPGDGLELPPQSFTHGPRAQFYPDRDPAPQPDVPVEVDSESDRLQILEPFDSWNGKELKTRVVVKVQGKCTTDHISAAGPWLKYKGHLENISENTLIGAVNAETGETNSVRDIDESTTTIPDLMKRWKSRDIPWAVVAEDNYGEGSAREHAALSPRFLGGRLVLVKSFARIHETNLKKQGVLPLWFENPADYDKINSLDIIETIGLPDLVAKKGDNGGTLGLKVTKPSGESFEITAKHTMSSDQVEFFAAGSAINYISNMKKKKDAAAAAQQ